ncbi:MAG TPA: hypothetical protein VGJ15_13090, partial [Pirellulales bacterium]
MTDHADDPWKLLANDLGVQPAKEPARPAPTPTPATPHTTSFRAPPPPAPAEHKKPEADWNALAGELGLALPPAGESRPAKPDPVAEVLGIPRPSVRQDFEPTADKPKYRDADPEVDEFDEFDSYGSRPRREENSPDDAERDRPEGEREAAQQEPLDPRDIDPRTRDNDGSEDRQYRPSRRRGRRGR